MGTPLPPNEAANLCTACFGPATAFGDTPTPRVVIARLTRLLPGEFWTDDDDQLLLISHYLEQTLAPCIFRINDGKFLWTLQWFAGFTEFRVIRLSDNRSVFFAASAPGCALDITSEITLPANVVAFNGFANLTWNPEDL